MQTSQTSASSPGSLAKTLACLLALGWALLLSPAAAAAEEPAALTTAELEALMLPPVGWKVDEEEMSDYLWCVTEPDVSNTKPVFYPFWPMFIKLDLTDDGHVRDRDAGYDGPPGGLLTSALDSPDAGVRRKAELWLRHSLILYFTGFRLSRIQEEGHRSRPYAPWIKPADSLRLDRLADQYLAQQRLLIHSGMHPKEVSELELAQWLSNPGGTTLADVYGYFDAVGATHELLPLYFNYPISWIWSRNVGNQTLTPEQNFGNDLSGGSAWRLIGSTVPDSPDPVSLWLRDVYLSYIAGKELFESKLLPTVNEGDAPRLKEAVHLWWKHIEQQK